MRECQQAVNELLKPKNPHDIVEMNHPIQRTSRRQENKRSRNAPCAETFTPESAKGYVLDLLARGRLRIRPTGSPPQINGFSNPF